eukprot:1146234-Pelagomonas_calceolata.AAC.3
MTFLQMAHPVVESHGELRLWGRHQSLVLQGQGHLHRLGSLWFVVTEFAHRLAHGLVGLGASVRSQRPPKEKKNYAGSENTPHINERKEDT